MEKRTIVTRAERLDAEKRMSEMRAALKQKDIERAFGIIEPLVNKAKAYENVGKNAYDGCFDFDNTLETVLFRKRNDYQKEIVEAEYPFSKIYYCYGTLLMEIGRGNESYKMMKRAFRWNPASMAVRIKYMESLKAVGKHKELLKVIIDSLGYSYTRRDIGKCLRNLGWYFEKKKMYSEAVGFLEKSFDYDVNSQSVRREIQFIRDSSSNVIALSKGELEKVASEYGFSFKPDETVINTAYSLGKEAIEEGRKQDALFYWKIVNRLSADNKMTEYLNSEWESQHEELNKKEALINREPAGPFNKAMDKEVFIGRSDDCDIVVDSITVEKYQARLWNDGNDWFLHGIDAGENTFMNGNRVRDWEIIKLSEGGKIQLGNIGFTVYVDAKENITLAYTE